MSFKIIATGFLVLMTFVETQIRAILTIFDSFLENTNRLRSAGAAPERPEALRGAIRSGALRALRSGAGET